MNELGFAVVAPNIRGSSGYGKTYVALDNGSLRDDAVKDLGALIVWLGTQAASMQSTPWSPAPPMEAISRWPRSSIRRPLGGGVDFGGIGDFIGYLTDTAPYRQSRSVRNTGMSGTRSSVRFCGEYRR